MFEEVPVAEENIKKGAETIKEVSKSLKELEFFKGRFLRHIYNHKRMIDREFEIEKGVATEDFRNAPPIFSAME